MIIELLAAAGFLISYYITSTVHNHGTLACPIGKSCNEVVESKYGSLLGIRNDFLGMLYYFAVFTVAYLKLPVPHELMLLLTGAAAAMSLLLLFIQAFILRKWCDFCVGSIVIAVSIFVLNALSIG